MNRNPHLAVVGATGAVGIEMIKTLEKRNFPAGKVTLLASARSAGKKLKYRGQDVTVQELTKDSFKGIDIALFSAGGSIIEGICADRGEGGLRGDRQLERVPHGRRGCRWWSRNQRRGREASPGNHREPELHDGDHADWRLYPLQPGVQT